MHFSRPLVTLARCVSFVAGALAVLLLLTLFDESIVLHVTLGERNLLWYVGVLSAVFAMARSLVPTDYEAESERARCAPETALRLVAEHTHYQPDRWRGRAHTHAVRDEFLALFKFKAALFYEELVCVLLSPLIMCFSLPSCARAVLDFVRENTVDVDGLGSVLGQSLFDFSQYGNEEYAAGETGARAPARTARWRSRSSTSRSSTRTGTAASGATLCSRGCANSKRTRRATGGRRTAVPARAHGRRRRRGAAAGGGRDDGGGGAHPGVAAAAAAAAAAARATLRAPTG